MKPPQSGTLYLIPSNLAEPIEADRILPLAGLETARGLNHFIAENAKSARAFLKAIGISRPIQEISILEMQKHGAEDMAALMAPLLAGENVGLLSEAGAPAVADPGALIVAAAHAQGIRVAPVVGASALLLGLMASGLNGQRFAFQGYLPQDKSARLKTIGELERESRQKNMTQFFIETPYRNQALFADLLETLAGSTRLCIAANLTAADEHITTRSVHDWKKSQPTLDRVPTLFLFLA
jgi:16S rRNA (cytidine1402-2'-O)-methyltransferase